MTDAERFWSKVDKSGGDELCWLWTGALVHGYGQFAVVGRSPARAHRYAWLLAVGAIPDGLHVCHRCDALYPVGDRTNRRCVNPAHLFLGTHADNMRDMWRKGRNAPMAGCPSERQARGMRRGGAKMTDDRVREARARAAAGESHRSLSRAFGIGQSTVQAIVSGHTWKHVQ